MDDESEERLEYTQRLKAAVHYTVGKLCESIAAEHDKTIDKNFIAAVTETTFRQAAVMAEDLEAFAKHAKRTTVNAEDVKLMVRRSEELYAHIKNMSNKQTAENETKRKKKDKKKPAAVARAVENTVTDEDTADAEL